MQIGASPFSNGHSARSEGDSVYGTIANYPEMKFGLIHRDDLKHLQPCGHYGCNKATSVASTVYISKTQRRAETVSGILAASHPSAEKLRFFPPATGKLGAHPPSDCNSIATRKANSRLEEKIWRRHDRMMHILSDGSLSDDG